MGKRKNLTKRNGILETGYEEGVYSEGKQVIRALTDEEKVFLDKFNEEFGCASFGEKGSNLHDSLIKKNSKPLKYKRSYLKKLNRELKELKETWKTLKVEDRVKYHKTKKRLIRRIEKVKREIKELNVKKSINSNNYNRSLDPMNSKGKITFNVLDMAKKRSGEFFTSSDSIDITSEWELLENLDAKYNPEYDD